MKFLKGIVDDITLKKIGIIILGAGICSFGIHNIHQRVGITEGGVIGFMLLMEHWFHMAPSLLTTILDITCYMLAFRYLGGKFIVISVFSTLSVSMFYEVWEFFPFLLPDLSSYPFLAAIFGGLFVGVGVGMIVSQGGSSGGDDALALTISHLTHWRLSKAYLFTDFVVLGLSLSYIPISNIIYSIITVMTSSYIIDRIHVFSKKNAYREENISNV